MRVEKKEEKSTAEKLREKVDTVLRLRVIEEGLTKQLEGVKVCLKALSDVDIPALFDALLLDSITYRDGLTVALVQGIKTSIKAAEKDKAYQWLRDNGHGSIIKSETKTSVHPQTLCALGRELFDAGDMLPPDFFNSHIHNSIKIRSKNA